MSKVINDQIQDLNISWENYAGSSVEEFIKRQLKSRCGYLYRTPSKIGDYYYIYGFMDMESFFEWEDTSDNDLILFKIQLPNIENDTFAANLETNSNMVKLVNLGEGVKINLRYTSTSTNPTTGIVTDTYNDGTLIIMRSANGSIFSEVGRIQMSPLEHTSTEWKEIDITKYLADGDNKIRLRVEDNTTGAISNNLNFKSIINTTLSIENATDLSKPLTSFALQYYIQGQVAKSLNIKITDATGTKTYHYSLGEATYVEVPYNLVIDDTFTSGVKTVEAWLSVDDTTLESNHITNQFYLIDPNSEESVVILNNVNTTIANYANTKFFDFVVYNRPSDVTITVKNGSTTYLTYTYKNCGVGKVYSFWNTLEIESETKIIDALVTVKTSTNTVTQTIKIDNTEDFNPTAGADFILNPKLRSNTEEYPNTIKNEADGKTIKSAFENFKFVNDGWVTDDNGINVLRVAAGNKLTINYDPIDKLTNGTTIEIDFKTHDIFDEDEPLFRFCSYDAKDNMPLGFELKALEAIYMTRDNRVKRDQDIMFQDNVRTHVAINIVPNLSNSKINYIRLFVNGTINREMTYEDSDIFENGTNTIEIGGKNCDIDIYSLRVYKKGLSASDIRQDYMSSLPSMQDKIAYKSANNILSSDNTISYDKASVLYNTLVWTGKHPEYSTGNVKFTGSLAVNILDDNEHSGVISNIQIKGQGSSSRGYWRWNHQYDFKDKTKFVDKNGEEHEAYRLTDDVPWSTVLCAKLNWASSMQSHKLGACALYNDLWKSIVGGNGITRTQGYEDCRVAVYQKPFLYFFKETEDSQPVFAGLVTFGAAKKDMNNFGFDSNVFPNVLWLEGSDNGMPLTLRQVPWIDTEVSYNEDEEYYEYAGGGSWDYDAGNRNNYIYFRDANNFVYQHSSRLKPYNGDLVAINKEKNLDRSYQYWNTTNGDVYRYDYISDTFVDAGIECTTTCEYHYATQEDVDAGTASALGMKVIDVTPVYTKLNIAKQTGISISSDYAADNNRFINWRVNDFKKKISTYYDTTDVLFNMALVKLVAASDNWCKNTYEYLDPVSFKIRMLEDDIDTIFLTDNVGRKTKPYYVEEHDMNGTNPYWNGSDNVFFNLMETAFNAEYRTMLKTILNTMASTQFGGSVDSCLERYFYAVQKYFPSVAFNETARILYEAASVAQKTLNASGDGYLYTNGTPAITQSLGDQLQAETQWWSRRKIYMASLAASAPFDIRSTGSLGFRSLLTTESTNPMYSFALKPYMWLYPKVGTGQTLGADNTRVQPDDVYKTITLTTDSNTDTFIYGANYYTDFGEFGDKSIGEAFNLSGARLLRFSADSRQVTSYQFRPTSMTVNCPVLKYLSLYGCSTLNGQLNLSQCKKLETIDLRGTGINALSLPETSTLTSLSIPNLNALNIVNCNNLTEIVCDGSYSNLTSLTTDSSLLAKDVFKSTANLTSVKLINVDVDLSSELASYSNKLYNVLLSVDTQCTGTIKLNKTLTIEEKFALMTKYGDIDDTKNALHIEYTVVEGTTLGIVGDNTLAQGRSKTYTYTYNGNDVKKVEWTVTNAKFESIQNGIKVTASTNSTNLIIIKCKVTKNDGSVTESTKNVNVIQNISIQSIKIADTEITKTGEYTIPVEISPSNYTVSVSDVKVKLDANDYVTLGEYDKDKIKITCNKIDFASTSEKILRENFEPNSTVFSDSVDINFSAGDTVELSIDLSVCTKAECEVFAIGSDISQWGNKLPENFGIIHMYHTSDKLLINYADNKNANGVKYNGTNGMSLSGNTLNITMGYNKDTNTPYIKINNNDVVGQSGFITADVLSTWMTQKSYYIGSTAETSTGKLSSVKYNYIKVVKNVNNEVKSIGMSMSITDIDNNKHDGTGTIWLTKPMTGCVIVDSGTKYSFDF